MIKNDKKADSGENLYQKNKTRFYFEQISMK